MVTMPSPAPLIMTASLPLTDVVTRLGATSEYPAEVVVPVVCVFVLWVVEDVLVVLGAVELVFLFPVPVSVEVFEMSVVVSAFLVVDDLADDLVEILELEGTRE